jgi:hypothetical protein
MFVDFKDFILISNDLTPEHLVSSIDLYFETFDKIVTDHDIEKIKTVGDAYLCAARLPGPNTKNPVEMVDVAFKFLNEVERLKRKRISENKTMIDVRIGIHSGLLIAGVVGTKKFAYEIWGDAVNTAARMQQNGEQREDQYFRYYVRTDQASFSLYAQGNNRSKKQRACRYVFCRRKTLPLLQIAQPPFFPVPHFVLAKPFA